MGNLTSCFCANLKTAKLIDFHGNLRVIKLPITAAEIMILEQPGHLVSPIADDLRSNFRLSALPADQVLTNGKVYLLIPVGRLNSFTTESELGILRSCCKRVKQVKRRRVSKVLPEEKRGGGTEEVGGDEGVVDGLGPSQEDFSFTGRRVCCSPVWKPVLEPIYE